MNKYKGTVKKYDQSFSGVNTKKTRAGKVDFNVSVMYLKQLKQAYGKSLRKLPSANNGTKMYAYSRIINITVLHSQLKQ